MAAIDHNGDGMLDGMDELRFDASSTGGDWDSATIYWLNFDGAPTDTTPPSPVTVLRSTQSDAVAAHEPRIEVRRAIDLARPLNAEAIYIAPAPFHAALQPLLDLRATQGVRAVVVDAQAIFDTWSYGQTAPDAIRDFLRYARMRWTVGPRAVVLVGDGTFNPTKPDVNRDASVIPPYAANVDLWLGTTACDWCYAQLDGDDPRSDLRTDILYGRLPVRTAAQLRTVVAKIVNYETQANAAWRYRTAFVADNFRSEDGTADSAGNFAWLVDSASKLRPNGWSTQNMYYDPYPGTNTTQPWRVSDADAARARTREIFNQGAAFVTYSGHGMLDRWADTARGADGATWLLHNNDIASLTNADRLPIVLEMACLTGSFQDDSVDAIDEQLLLAPNGGAVAVAGFSGWSVTYVHEHLLRGMFNKIRSANGAPVLLGEIMAAGQAEMLDNAECCQEVLRTMVLLGDPMMQVRTATLGNSVFLPLAMNGAQ
jgi:Peptidase family C25